MRSSRERNAATTHPRRCRSSRTMGEFYLMTRKRLRRQVVEFVDVRGFDDLHGHNGSVLVPTAATSQRRTADRDRRAAAHFDPFQLVIGKEGYGATVGRPEREHGTLGACKGLRRS